jgi:hypothetical protein
VKQAFQLLTQTKEMKKSQETVRSLKKERTRDLKFGKGQGELLGERTIKQDIIYICVEFM